MHYCPHPLSLLPMETLGGEGRVHWGRGNSSLFLSLLLLSTHQWGVFYYSLEAELEVAVPLPGSPVTHANFNHYLIRFIMK